MMGEAASDGPVTSPSGGAAVESGAEPPVVSAPGDIEAKLDAAVDAATARLDARLAAEESRAEAEADDAGPAAMPAAEGALLDDVAASIRAAAPGSDNPTECLAIAANLAAGAYHRGECDLARDLAAVGCPEVHRRDLCARAALPSE